MSRASSSQHTTSAGAGHSRWVRVTHWIVAASVLTLAVSGFTILMAHPRLYWGAIGNDLTPALLELPVSRNYRHGGWAVATQSFPDGGSAVSAVRTYGILNQDGWARSLHFLAAWFLVVTGAAYLLAGIFTGHLRRDLVPRTGELTRQRLWNHLTSRLQRKIRAAAGGPPYGLVQKCTYCAVVFLGLPLMVITGMGMSPAITAAYPWLCGMFGGSQSARTIHFCVFALLLLFVVVHVVMVATSGFGRQMRAMTFGKANMNSECVITSRRTLITGLASAGGLLLGGCSETEPPTYGKVLRMGDLLTYRAQRLLLPTRSLAKEYSRSDITSIPAIGTTDPADPRQWAYNERNGALYQRLRSAQFADWRLRVEGSVARPGSYALGDLQHFPARTQITKHTCEEGWSAIAEWTGVPLRTVLEAAGIRPSARFVSFYAFDDDAESIDMLDALHPQTILAYGMNGGDLPIAHGAPLRLRVERQLGYKSLKFLHRIVVTDRFEDLGKLSEPRNGWAWYVGI